MIKISNVSYENEIYRVDSLSNEDSKDNDNFVGETLISRRCGQKI